MSTLRVNNMTNVGGTGPTWEPGNIVQVVYGSYSTETSTTSTSYVSSGLTATITPKFATSKILVAVSNDVTVSSAVAALTMFRGTVSGTNLAPGTSGFGRSYGEQVLSWEYLDSPATTSPVTYTLGFKTLTSGTVYAQNGSTPGSITLMEVAA